MTAAATRGGDAGGRELYMGNIQYLRAAQYVHAAAMVLPASTAMMY